MLPATTQINHLLLANVTNTHIGYQQRSHEESLSADNKKHDVGHRQTLLTGFLI